MSKRGKKYTEAREKIDAENKNGFTDAVKAGHRGLLREI